LAVSRASRSSESRCLSPLPRAFQWADGSAYVNHVELVRKARGAEMPASFWTDPLMYQGGSDCFLGPHAPVRLADEAWGIDFEAEVAVITDDVPMGVAPEMAGRHIKLVMLVNDVSLRNLIPGELAKGFGFFQSKPSSAFSPVAVTPDSLGPAWDGAKLHGPLLSSAQRHPLRAPRCRPRHDLRLSHPHRPRRQDPASWRRHHHRLRDGVEPRRGWVARPADR
jgi:fumarylacetoacetate (FAA) hydrolase